MDAIETDDNCITSYEEGLKGYELFQSEKYEKAIEHFNKLINTHPVFLKSYWWKAKCLKELNRIKEAKQVLDELIESNNSNEMVEILMWKGSIFYHLLKEYEETIPIFKKVIELDPNIWNPYINIGLSYFRQKMTEKSIEWFNKAIEIFPECSEAYCNKGVSLISLGKYEEAIECFEKAIQIRPNYPLALQNYGSALVELKKYDVGLEYINKAIDLDPENDLFYYVKSIVLSDMVILGEAIESINKAISFNPYKGEYYFKKIQYLIFQFKKDEAVECFKAGKKIDKNMFSRWPEFETIFNL